MSELNHIKFSGRTTSLPYSTHGGGSSSTALRNKSRHGAHIRKEFTEAVNEFTEDEDYEYVYLQFISAINFELDPSKFDNSTGDFRLASCRAFARINDQGQEEMQYSVTAYLNKKAVAKFLKKVEEYLTRESNKGKPRNAALVANIEEIRAATLQSFWQEPEQPFPPPTQNVWWEVWLSRNPGEPDPDSEFVSSITEDILIGNRRLFFPEHVVLLVKGTANDLSRSLLKTSTLAELRKPSETAEFFTYLDKDDQGEFINDLNERVALARRDSISVCLLDTGVNRVNPLLAGLIPERNLDSVEPHWTKADTHAHGHGTPMAGLIFFGDLTEALSTSESIQIFHHLESIKIVERGHANDPELYGKITLEAVSRAETINPEHKRVVCLAVTDPECNHGGKPSSWSSAIDQLVFDQIEEGKQSHLVLISSGNLPLEKHMEYPLANDDCSVHDPGQAFNAITVGAYTKKDTFDSLRFSGAVLLAQRGEMAPCNTTSVSWNTGWSRKPDIVFEGGNVGVWNNDRFDPDSIQVLSTGKGGIGKSWLTTFGDTSGAAALGSKFLAELYAMYPQYYPETIRGLLIHSADWTPQMLRGRQINQLSIEERAKLISQVGYGVPNLKKAKYSVENALTLIAERELTPFQLTDRVKPKEFHLFNLPWPTEVLQELSNAEVKLTVTLSYFIEPNPGNKTYSSHSSYRSYGLYFKMKDRSESDQAFRARVSKAEMEESYGEDGYIKEGAENWILTDRVRNKGSIHKDCWIGPAAELAMKNQMAVYPVGGWWKTRKKLQRYNNSVRYSLIISIEAPNLEVDLYNSVLNEISISI